MSLDEFLIKRAKVNGYDMLYGECAWPACNSSSSMSLNGDSQFGEFCNDCWSRQMYTYGPYNYIEETKREMGELLGFRQYGPGTLGRRYDR